MEPNQVNPSPENSEIPASVPAGVFVPNNQTPSETSVQDTTQQATEVVAQAAPVVDSSQSAETPVAPVSAEPKKEGSLDKVFKGVARFFAKVMGQPDPITGEVSSTSKKSQNIVGKVRGAANQVVDKASEAATKAANTVNQATEKIQQVVPPVPGTTTPEQPEQPAPEQPAPEQPAPEQPAPEQPTPEQPTPEPVK